MRLIDADVLYKQLQDAEELARNRENCEKCVSEVEELLKKMKGSDED